MAGYGPVEVDSYTWLGFSKGAHHRGLWAPGSQAERVTSISITARREAVETLTGDCALISLHPNTSSNAVQIKFAQKGTILLQSVLLLPLFLSSWGSWFW